MDFDSDEERLIYLQGEVDALENLKNVVKIIVSGCRKLCDLQSQR